MLKEFIVLVREITRLEQLVIHVFVEVLIELVVAFHLICCHPERKVEHYKEQDAI